VNATDQRRVAAEQLLEGLIAKYLAAHPSTSSEKLDNLRAEYWSRWADLKSEIDRGIASLDRDGGRPLDRDLVEGVKRRGRQRLARSRAV
jgi:hypothetical protein